jgi:transcription-repair coupling factor (superfamily II helicase)
LQHLDFLVSKLADPAHSANITGLRGSGAALLAARISRKQEFPSLCIVPGEPQARTLCQDLAFVSNLPVFHFPAHEIPPYTPLSPDQQTVSTRIFSLYKAITSKTPYILVASAEALLRRIMPRNCVADLVEILISGEETDQKELTGYLIKAGYEQMSLVQNSGEFSIRGGIFDIFPTGSAYPVRLDFFGDYIESLRLFDPITQRSIEEVQEVELIPASDILFPDSNDGLESLFQRIHQSGDLLGWTKDEREVFIEKISNGLKFPGIEFFMPFFYPELDTPLSYLPEKSRIFIFEPLEVAKSVTLSWERITANYNESNRVQSIALPPESLFVPKEELYAAIQRKPFVQFNEFKAELSSPSARTKLIPLKGGLNRVPLRYKQIESSTSLVQNIQTTNGPAFCEEFTVRSTNHTLIKQNIELQRKKSGLLEPLSHYLTSWLEQNDHIHIACRSQKHAVQLAQMLENYHLPTQFAQSGFQEIAPLQKAIYIYPDSLSEGFDLPDEQVHFISEKELFGAKRLAPAKKGRSASAAPALSFEELNIGDIVVHSSHGLGVYNGIVNLELNNLANDFLHISYKDGDKLYVPIDRINSVSKYNGLSDRKPALSRLGSKIWANTKKKIKNAVWEVAQHLLHLYARRKLEEGHIFSNPDALFHELEESFPYDETEGQKNAIKDVIDDLTSDRCMDRLVCGDVGFGKTEVAVRAAFKVIEDGSQVAMLVPTTVLAEQHAQTFMERFEGFPVNVECLNRFRSQSEQKKIVGDLRAGKVDILIGTHRILSKDVRFKNLGLMIIDEEHRFGVTHKEKLKTLRTGVDVLTLTATPIPRTLQMSLLGVRDLSVISSPPRHRQSVKTFVSKYDDLVIKEAVTRELQRGGQVFFVHNRVKSIHDVANKIQDLVPEARISVAHGQMPGKVLEEIMVNFVQKKVNVLVCTTIIESGLDIPNANTIIINRADMLGLAEIYQLRGRVGRSSEQAFAYLLVPSLEHLSKDAKQRLRALMDYNELGGGFKLALSDLQIRGGGNILGESQSGNIAAVGYDLYLDLLQRTVEDLKRKAERGEAFSDDDYQEPEINLSLSAFIANKYIPDPNQRYIAYKRITSVADSAELDDLKEEFTDRYGKMPKEAENLFAIIEIKDFLKKYKVTKLEQSAESLVFSFHSSTEITPEQILRFIRKSKGKVRMTPDSRLVVSQSIQAPNEIFQSIKNTLHAIIEKVM